MTQNVNPNSRARFVDKDGQLTKYGMDVIGNITRAIGLIGSTSVLDSIQNELGDFSLLYKTLSENTVLAKRLDDIDAQSEFPILMARIKHLESKIEELEQQHQPVLPIHEILQRLDTIESQL